MSVPEWLSGAGPESADSPLDTTAMPVRLDPRGRFIPTVGEAARFGEVGQAGQVGGSAEADQTALKCAVLLQLGAALLEHCGNFFDPVVLAQLDGALAYELARRARTRREEALERVQLCTREGRAAEAVACLAQQASAAKSAATKAASQAAKATAVITNLGGAPTASGYDPEIVDHVSAAQLIDTISALEEAKNALSAVQVQAQALFVAQQRLCQARKGVPQQKLGAGIAHQVALARHESPHRGRQICELGEILVREMPHSMNAFVAGRISEFRASLMVRETAILSLENRVLVDQLISADTDALALLGTRELSAACRKAACELDPEATVRQHEKALGDRHVSLRPAQGGMTFLTALVPLKQGVRILATLTRVANSAKASGDQRGRGQIMADALMHRLIQHAPCDDGAGSIGDHRGTQAENGVRTSREPWCTAIGQPDIALELIMTDRSLFGSASDPAILSGYEPIPAPMARTMILGDYQAAVGGSRVWLKRLFTHPGTNTLMAMDSRSRIFPDGMKEFLRLQDQRCRTPYCDAPIREYDHVKAYAAGGPTSIINGQGLCAACNQAKEGPGWLSGRSVSADDVSDSDSSNGQQWTEVNTPTGHRYLSCAPALPGKSSRKPSWRASRQC